jgi:hypothetical protein
MNKLNLWINTKFAQYSILDKQSKIIVWILGFLILFAVELLIAGICYECHVPMVNGWTNEIVLKPY